MAMPCGKTCFAVASSRSSHSRPSAATRQLATCGRYRDHNQVERLFNRLKQSRRIATRYNKNAASFLSFLSLAAAKIWITDYVNKA